MTTRYTEAPRVDQPPPPPVVVERPDDGFIRAIVRNPEDDHLRLVYADWLQENSQELRAEFIRVQIELARLIKPDCDCGNLDKHPAKRCPAKVYDETKERLQGRERELLVELWGRGELTRGLPGVQVLTNDEDGDLRLGMGMPDGYGLMLKFFRGFVSSVSCTTQEWREYGKAIVAAQPIGRVEDFGEEAWATSMPWCNNTGFHPNTLCQCQSGQIALAWARKQAFESKGDGPPQ